MLEQEPGLQTRRDFLIRLGRLGLAGAGAALAASIPGNIARGDGSPTPPSPIQSGLLCEDPRFKDNPEVKISHTHLLGKIVVFPDEPEGILAVEKDDFYHDGLKRQLATAQGFFERFMDIKITSEVQTDPRYLMSKIPYREYIERRFQGISLIDVDLPRIYYDGTTYPIFILMYMATPDPGDNLEYPGTRGSYISFNNSRRDRAGTVSIPWLLAERYGQAELLWHEIGHAFGMDHNPHNPKSIMAVGTNVSRLIYGVEEPVLDSYDLGGMCPSYRPYGYKILIPAAAKNYQP
ncbi:hypothetical protein HYS96_00120 [Candidatus Daviesbacteria bacterium]|nr:hypothetical protein [Candidatus Daviesbacteria bacterium]